MHLRFACVLIAGLGVANLHCQASANDEIAATLDVAKTRCTERISDARQKVDDAFVKAIERAEGNRRLSTERKIEEIAMLKSAQTAFYESGALPSIRELSTSVTSYQRVLRIETERIRDAFDDAADAYGNASDLNAAKAVLAERDSFVKKIQTASSGFADLEIVSGAQAFSAFENRTRAFSNRGYIWGDVPAGFPFNQFSRLKGGATAPVRIRVKTPGEVFAAVENLKPDLQLMQKLGWKPTPFAFSHNARGKTKLVVLHQTFDVGEHDLPRVGFPGPTILRPRQAEQ